MPSSKYWHVSWHKGNDKWVAQIKENGVTNTLGSSKDEDAVALLAAHHLKVSRNSLLRQERQEVKHCNEMLNFENYEGVSFRSDRGTFVAQHDGATLGQAESAKEAAKMVADAQGTSVRGIKKINPFYRLKLSAQLIVALLVCILTADLSTKLPLMKAADIAALNQSRMSMGLRSPKDEELESKIAVLMVGHQLWTPGRMELLQDAISSTGINNLPEAFRLASEQAKKATHRKIDKVEVHFSS
jgi:hypothetical protein